MKRYLFTILTICFSTFLAFLLMDEIAKTYILFDFIEKNIPYEIADKLTQSFWGARPEHAYGRIHTIMLLFILFTTSGLIYSAIKTCIRRYRFKEKILIKTFAFESLILMIKPVYFFFLMYVYCYFLPQRALSGYQDHLMLILFLTLILAIIIPALLYFGTKYIIKKYIIRRK